MKHSATIYSTQTLQSVGAWGQVQLGQLGVGAVHLHAGHGGGGGHGNSLELGHEVDRLK